MAVALPDWCELARGDGPVLLVAPHGGRRPRVDPTAPPANLKVNDVYTAELTRELAARLHATAIINHGCDRNVLDLNRISQVRRRAPWFLDLLRDEIGGILAKYEQAEILFIHGWNVGQAKCDLGIGASEGANGLVTPDGARLTVTRSYLDDRITRLRTALEEHDIATFLGVRYPASHANNLLQAFTSRSADECHSPAEKQLSEWAAAGRLQALQLELGVPLRWPGRRREQMLNCLAAHFGPQIPPFEKGGLGGICSDRAAGARKSPLTPSFDGAQDRLLKRGEPEATGLLRRAASLQFYDPVADIGVLAGVGPIGKETSAARLLVFLGGQCVALFTGERTPPRSLVVEPLHIGVDADGTTLGFAGPILHLDDGATYLDLEAAFAVSALADIEVSLRFATGGVDAGGAEFGHIEGWIDFGGRRRAISAGGYVNAGIARAGQRQGYAMLAADFGGGHGLLANIADGAGTKVVQFREGSARNVDAAVGQTLRNAPNAASRPIELSMSDTSVLRATPHSRMEILRALGSDRYARVTFGTACFEWGDLRGHGIYEYARMAGSGFETDDGRR